MTSTCSYRISDGVVSRTLGRETVVVRISGPEVVVLNGTAGQILSLIGERADREQIVERLFSEYQVSRDELTHAVDGFLAELEAAKLIEAVTP